MCSQKSAGCEHINKQGSEKFDAQHSRSQCTMRTTTSEASQDTIPKQCCHHVEHMEPHAPRKDEGVMMRQGHSSLNAAMTATACTVLPSPISSPMRARPPCDSTNFTPSRWNAMSLPSRRGGSVSYRSDSSRMAPEACRVHTTLTLPLPPFVA
jgi:hypothetical protein